MVLHLRGGQVELVSGLDVRHLFEATTDAQKSSDMFAKCRYLDEITKNRGVIFATGTPISNSMTEMYTIQRYLQYDRLQQMGMTHFDS